MAWLEYIIEYKFLEHLTTHCSNLRKIIIYNKLQEEERKRREEEQAKSTVEMLQKRQEYKEKTKNALLFADMPSESKQKGRGRRRDEYISDSGSEQDRPREEGFV